MKNQYCSQKEKVGWILITLPFVGIIIALLGEPMGKFLSMLGFSQTLSNAIGENVNYTGCIVLFLGFICAPIGIIKVIRALKIERNLNINPDKKREVNNDFKERSLILFIKGLFIGTPVIVYLIIVLNTDKRFSLQIIPIVLIVFILREIFSYYFKQIKEKQGKLYTYTLDLAYKGDIKHGKANGKGIAYFYDGTKRFEGNFLNGKLNGKGIVYYTDGNIYYNGNLKDGLADGKGTIYYQNGNIASQGNFINDKLNGHGILYYDNGGIRYKGNFIDGKLEGRGTLYYDNGKILYKGNFMDGRPKGRGIMYRNNGFKRMEGNFLNGKLEGNGKTFYNTGDLFCEGKFKSGLLNGEGIMYDINGYEIYRGKFRRGKIRNFSVRFQILLYKLLFRKR